MEENPYKFYVYAYLRSKDSETSSAGTPYYIGKGEGKRRFGSHRKHIGVPKDKEHNVLVYEGLTEQEAFFEEMYLIDLYGRVNVGTGILRNRTEGGEGCSGLVTSEETRKKQSLAKKGKKQKPEHIEKLANLRRGKPRSPETRKAIGESQKGKIISPESRRKNSESQKGKKKKPESVAKRAAKMRGRKRDPKAVEKTAAALRGRKRPSEVVEKSAAGHRGIKRSPEAIEKTASKVRGVPQTKEHKEKRIKSRLGSIKEDKMKAMKEYWIDRPDLKNTRGAQIRTKESDQYVLTSGVDFFREHIVEIHNQWLDSQKEHE